MFTKAMLLLLCSGAFQAFSQPITWIHGARIASLANAGTAIEAIWNTSGNPAGIAATHSPALSLAVERRFLIEELDTKAAAAVLPVGKQVLGLNVNFFGAALYNRQLISFVYARALSPEFKLGFGLNYHALKIPGYAAAQAWSVTVGMQFSPLPRLTAGAKISNPNRAAFDGALKAEIPVVAALGGAWLFSQKVMAVAELEWTSGFSASLKGGLEYRFHPQAAVRAGVSTAPFRQYGGLGLTYKGFTLDVAASSHLQLGFTPQISIRYEF